MLEPINRITRRHFLEKSALVGTTFSLSAAAAAAPKRVSANDTLTVAVMGVNNQGRTHAMNFANQPGAEVAYVCDVDERVLPRVIDEVAKHQERKPIGVRDFRKVLDDPSVDIISIATPNHWHAPAAVMACAAGKHVYVEKPCSYSAEEGELLISAAQKYKRVIQMGTQRRSRAPVIEAIQRIREGVIGNVLLARTWYSRRRDSIGMGKLVEAPKELDFQLWQGPATKRPYKDNLVHYNWHWHWHWGNGELGNNGIHALDVARWGMDVQYPNYVVSSGQRIRFEDDQETPDTQNVAFHFGKRIITWEGVSWSSYGPGGSQFGILFQGDQGSLEIDDQGYRIYDIQNKEKERIAEPAGIAEHYANFLEAIRQDIAPNADIEGAHQSTLLCHLGNIAQRTGRSLNTDPKNGHILNDKAAQQLWGREEYVPEFDPRKYI